jgi:nitrite reductase/ring-hydroxylating ferredoxin subunit
MSLIN